MPSPCKQFCHMRFIPPDTISGDSYSQTGFDPTLTQPTIGNPLGNPVYPGYTSANGPNWIDYLTVKYNATATLTYNLAYGGATIDSALVAPYQPSVLSVRNQVEDQWIPTYASKPASAPWASDNTLFAFFDGINDVGNSWWTDTTTLNAQIFDVYASLVEKIYSAGGRNFAFLNVPPVDRSPLMLAEDASAQEGERADILAWNNLVLDLANNLKTSHPEANVFTIDTHDLFTKVLDNPASFPQTALYKNTTAYCAAYQNGTPTPDTLDPSCSIPVNEYLWLNSLHPTYPIHDALAEVVASQLTAGPNVC
ncbi:Thermolabile hemolysin 2 [Phlyctema vagabunda]|uniref:Thermolabile hemolysin 2 n=1 Tax=Phlyctema vagabunda TaxID=108571 RepID=A0ABR4PWM6_9HELO